MPHRGPGGGGGGGWAQVELTDALMNNLTIAFILKVPCPSSSAAMTYCFPLFRCLKNSFPVCVQPYGLMSPVVIIAN